MINKVYEKIKQILRENYKFLIFIISFILIFTLKFPYYINAPGGLLNVNDRVKINDSNKVNGSLNMAYVTEIKATIPTLIYGLINKDWDILKEEEITYENETIEQTYYRDHLLLQEATNNAIIVGFKKAKKQVEIVSSKFFVTYIDSKAQTDLKIGDEIISINGTQITDTKQVNSIINNSPVNSEITLEVLNNNKKYEKKAKIQQENNRLIIGILITEKKEIETTPKVELKFKKSESGPSGGLMTALAIYNYLTEEDITHGKKIVGTGTIDINGNVGSIGGIKYKLKGAVNNKAEIFIVPNGENYEDAMKLKKEFDYKIDIVGVSNIDDALKYLMDL